MTRNFFPGKTYHFVLLQELQYVDLFENGLGGWMIDYWESAAAPKVVFCDIYLPLCMDFLRRNFGSFTVTSVSFHAASAVN